MFKRISGYFFKMAFLLVIVSMVTFFLIEFSPIDAVSAYIGEGNVTQEQKARIESYWGLEDPPMVRYFKWADHMIHGDMGQSIIYKKSVSSVIWEHFKLSFWLMLLSWILSGIIGLLFGILISIYKGGLVEKSIRTYCLALESSPPFWIGMILLLIFSVKLKWLPMGLASPAGISVENASFSQRLQHLILPTIALSFTGISKITLQTAEKMKQILESDYAIFAFSRGESKWQFVFRHGLRNVMLPFITLQFGSISELFGGSVLAETVFTYPGLGNTTVQAAIRGDIPLFIGIALFSTAFVAFGNMIANILYSVVDPRIQVLNGSTKKCEKLSKG